EAGHAGQRVGPEPVDADDEYARKGRAGKRDGQVQGREAEVAPELSPVHDMARDAVGASQQRAGAVEVALRERRSHRGAGDALAIGEHAAELLEFETLARRGRLEGVHVAGAF